MSGYTYSTSSTWASIWPPFRAAFPVLADAWQAALTEAEPTPVYDAMLAEGWQR